MRECAGERGGDRVLGILCECAGECGGDRVLGILCELAPSQFCFNVNVRTVEVNNDHTKVGVPSHLLDLRRKQVHMSSVCVCACVL